MKKQLMILGVLSLLLVSQAPRAERAETRARVSVNIPDILGYQTLKCDLHIHTVFSDGLVWPSVRSEEAWREGLDVIAVTDHLEYQPHKQDLPTAHNRSFEIAQPHGAALGVTVVRGSEITRKMPPGHLNAVFLEDAEPLDTENWRDAVQAAHQQGAFIFWNHPGWRGQQPDGKAKWYPEHTELLERGMLHGIEVVNSREYYPEAHRWCIENNLTMLSNSDIHDPLNLDYFVRDGDHRPLTLVFVKENSLAGIKEALFARRTAVYSGNTLVGGEKFLSAIFDNSVSLKNSSLSISDAGSAYLQIRNESDISFQLEGDNQFEEISVPESLMIQANRTVLLRIQAESKELTETRSYALSYRVENLKIAPETGLPVVLNVDVSFVQGE
ncbi:MAG: Sb-PDE family phosphodiesterase [bacterium]